MSVIFLPPNADAKSRVGSWCLLALVALVPLVMWAQADRGTDAASVGAAFGAVLVKVLVPALVVALVARRMDTPWRAWWYAAAVLVPGVALVLAIDVVPARMAAADAAEARVDQARHLALPARLGAWQSLVGPEVDARLEALRAEMSQTPGEPGDYDLLYGEYRGGRVPFNIVGFTTGDGAFGRELSHDTDEALSDFVAGFRSLSPVPMDAGPLGGSMTCAAGTEIAPLQVHCIWSDALTMAAVIYGGTLDLEDAAKLTRRVRSDVTVLD